MRFQFSFLKRKKIKIYIFFSIQTLHSLSKRDLNAFSKYPTRSLSYRVNNVNCLGFKCGLQAIIDKNRIKKLDKKNQLKNFACIGNPYIGNGSKCYPLEGLYIG